MQTFQKGDTVQLKSGGPVMCIQFIDADCVQNEVGCSWFVGDTLKDGSFSSASLEKAGPSAVFQAKNRR